MYTRFKNSILNPKMISQYTNSKLKTFGYFIFLLIIYTLPSTLYVCFTGGIDNSYFVEMTNAYSKTETTLFVADYKLYSLLDNEKHYVNTEFCGMYFLPHIEDASSDNIKAEISLMNTSTKQYELVFTRNNIVGVYSINNVRVFVNLATYEEIGIMNAKLSLDDRVVVGNQFSGILYGVYNKYKTLITICSIPTILISGAVSLLLMLLIPTLILYLFNRPLKVKYGKIYHMGIYAFTIFVFANVITLFISSQLLLILCQLISFFYLSTALRQYFITTNGGFKDEL